MLYTLSEWLVPVVMVPVVANRHSPTRALAWLIFIFFQPWIGLLLYLLFGEKLLTRRRIKDYCQRVKEIPSLDALQIQEPHVFRLPKNDPLSVRMVQVTERLVCMPIVSGNVVELLDDGARVIDRLVADIDAAKKSVHLLFYIYNDDHVGRRVSEALARAAARGVHCRLAVDAFGGRFLNRSLGPWMIAQGIEFHTLMPMNPFRRHLTRIDLRNHRKLVVIDGALGYTGSQNIEDQHYDRKHAEAWHDVMVRLTGPAVLQLQLIFVEDWYFATDQILEGPDIFPAPSTHGDIPIQVVPSGPIHSPGVLRDLLIAAIYEARRNVAIISPYFVPDEPFMLALHHALLRGVKVELLIPKKTDHPIFGAVARAYLESLVTSGITAYFHKGVLHVKAMSVDDSLLVIGTANFDRRSFFLHSELCLLLYGSDITGRFHKILQKYIGQSYKIDYPRWRRRSRAKRIINDTLKLLSPLL